VRGAVLAAALLVLAAATTTPAAAAPRLEVGVQDDAVLVRDPWAYLGAGPAGLPSRARALASARAVGASVVRMNVRWDKIAPDGGPPRFARLDRAVDRTRAQALRVQFTLTGPAPAGGTTSGEAGITDPLPQAFARFAAATARHFAGRVRRYSIWNEPNWPTSLQPAARAGAIYRALYEAAEPAIRRAVPGAQVLFGELAPMGAPEAAIPPLRFLRSVFACTACAPLVTDGIALHPYTLRWAPSFPGPGRDDVTLGSLPRLTRMTDRLVRAGALRSATGRRLDLYLTEYGFFAGYARIPEPLRAVYARQAFDVALRAPRVRQLVWYQIAQPPRTGARLWDTALLSADGRSRPTARALRAWAREHRRSLAPLLARR
jgi:hypothetical protein